MKQLVDYYHVLRHSEPNPQSIDVIERVGLKPFAQAVMYIMQQYGLPVEKMLFKPNEKLGKLLLSNILEVGSVSLADYQAENKVHKFFRRLYRMMRMLPMAPSELIWVVPRNIDYWLIGKM